MRLHLVQLVHFIGIIWMIIIPFQDEVNLLVVHVSASLSILIHWLANDNTCFLSMVEAKIRGIPKNSGFIHSLIAPIYDMNKIQINCFAYAALFLLAIISIYKIVTSQRWKNMLKLYSKTNKISSFLLLLKPSNKVTS